jgi:hypothetical protein
MYACAREAVTIHHIEMAHQGPRFALGAVRMGGVLRYPTAMVLGLF